MSMAISWVSIAAVALLLGLVLQVPAIMFICLAISLFSMFKVCNRYEFSIASLLIGTAVLGATGGYLGMPWLGKLLGLLSLYILKDTFSELKRRQGIIIVLAVSLAVCVLFYFLGPKTAVSKNKLFEVFYYSIIYVFAFNALIKKAGFILFNNLGLALLWFVACYVFVVTVYELGSTSVNILQVSGVRIAITQINLASIMVDDVGWVGSSVSYQLIGNTSALSLLFIATHYFSSSSPKLKIGWILVVFLAVAFIVISGARQSVALLLICIFSFLMLRRNIDRRRVYYSLALMMGAAISVVIGGLANEVPSIVSLFEAGKDVASLINRDTNFNAAIELIEAKPWMGHGFGGFYIPALGVYSGEFRLFPHNVILELWSEMGLLGMVVFLSGWFFLYFHYVNVGGRKTINNIYLPGGYSLLPILLFYLGGALMNEILVRSMAFFVLMAFYVSGAKE